MLRATQITETKMICATDHLIPGVSVHFKSNSSRNRIDPDINPSPGQGIRRFDAINACVPGLSSKYHANQASPRGNISEKNSDRCPYFQSAYQFSIQIVRQQTVQPFNASWYLEDASTPFVDFDAKTKDRATPRIKARSLSGCQKPCVEMNMIRPAVPPHQMTNISSLAFLIPYSSKWPVYQANAINVPSIAGNFSPVNNE